MVRIEIRLESGGAQNEFFSGQIVNGHALIFLDQPSPVKAITLRVNGAAEVRWEEWPLGTSTYRQKRKSLHHGSSSRLSRDTRLEPKVFQSQELYLDYKIPLLPPAASNAVPAAEDLVLAAGEHKFPFNFNLPHNIPSSYEGQLGNVRYVAVCQMDTSDQVDFKARLVFSVVCPLDLNRFPNLAIQADASAVKTFWGLFRRSKPITVVLRLPESGIVPGQLITPSIDIDNGSDVRINQVKLTLSMKVIYSAMGKKKMEKKTLLQNCIGSVEPKKMRTWFQGLFLRVPPLAPSGLNNCTLIDISYKLKVIAEPDRPHLDIAVDLPLTVGSIPFQAFAAPSATPTPNSLTPGGWNSPSTSNPVTPTYTEASAPSFCPTNNEPPSYEETMAHSLKQHPEMQQMLANAPNLYPPINLSEPSAPEKISDMNT